MRKLKLLTGVVISTAAVAGVAYAASSPSVTTGPASSITDSSAVLNGVVSANGATTSYQFQWGLTNAYGLASASKTTNSSKPVSVSHTATHLLPGTVYHYRLLALNKFGGTLGADRTFKTAGNPPPGAATGPTSQVGKSTATITGVINPHGAKTTWVFQWGLTAAYSYQTFGGSVPAGSAPVTVVQSLSGLASGTTFHYRLVAYHGSSVVSVGGDATFITEPLVRPKPRVRASTTPHRAPHKPFTFTTSGKVLAPSRFPASVECTGDVSVKFMLGRTRVSSSLIALQPNCTFSTVTVFRRLPGRGRRPRSESLQVQVQFRGNGYVAPASARTQTVQLG